MYGFEAGQVSWLWFIAAARLPTPHSIAFPPERLERTSDFEPLQNVRDHVH
jgi:hypothetical protein